MDIMDMGKLEEMDSGFIQASEGFLPLISSFKENDCFQDDSASYERFLAPYDTDSFFDDLANRLIISRMVNDSVVKGIVNAVKEEADERISEKEAEIESLRENLSLSKSEVAKLERFLEHKDKEMASLNASLNHSNSKTSQIEEVQAVFTSRHHEHFNEEPKSSFKMAIEDHLRRMKQEIEDGRVLAVNGLMGISEFSSLNGHMDNMTKMFSKSHVEKGIARSSVKDMGLNPCEIYHKFQHMIKVYDSLKNGLDMVWEQVSDTDLIEWKWKFDAHEEVNAPVLKGELQGKSVIDSWEQNGQVADSHRKQLSMQIDVISSLRQELDATLRSLTAPEPGQQLSHGSQEVTEEQISNAEKKNQVHHNVMGNRLSPGIVLREENDVAIALEKFKEPKNNPDRIPESGELRHMSKEELMTYFTSEMTKMKRNYESTVHELTEAFFSLKRKHLKEKGSSPLRRDKESDGIRKRITEAVIKLDDMIKETAKLALIEEDYQKLCSLKDKLLSENQHLREMLADKNKEVKYLSSQVSDAANKMSLHSLTETNFLKQIKKLRCDIEDLNVEIFIREEVYKDVVRELGIEFRGVTNDFLIEASVIEEIYAIIYEGAIRDIEAYVNSTLLKYGEEMDRLNHLETKLLEKEEAICSDIKEKEVFKQEISSLLSLMGEKENVAVEASAALKEQKERLDLVTQELNMFKEQSDQQEKVIDEKNRELNSVSGRLKEALKQVGFYKLEMKELDQELTESLNDLGKAREQISFLEGVVQNNQQTVCSLVMAEEEQRKRLEATVKSAEDLFRALIVLQNRIYEGIGKNSLRLENLNKQFYPLVRHANSLRKKNLLYKQGLERRYSDLQKAEVEVDLLGDEVDTLLSLLEKIYIALDHYSPILQHYPGIMEILKLIQRELKGEVAQPI
ncbi:hypothetical protein AMTRI_Chr02g254940 [Amborella trichopoda]